MISTKNLPIGRANAVRDVKCRKNRDDFDAGGQLDLIRRDRIQLPVVSVETTSNLFEITSLTA